MRLVSGYLRAGSSVRPLESAISIAPKTRKVARSIERSWKEQPQQWNIIADSFHAHTEALVERMLGYGMNPAKSHLTPYSDGS
jgi:hypothetical protein